MKKWTCLLLALLLLTSALSACSSETPAAPVTTETEPVSDSPIETPTEMPTQTPEETPAEAEKPQDEPAAPAFIGSPKKGDSNTNGGITLPLTEELVSFDAWSISQVESYGITDLNESYAWQEMENRTNVHLNWTLEPGSTASEKFNLSLVSGDYFDTYWTRDVYSTNTLYVGGYDRYLDDGILIDLADLIDTYAPNYKALMNYSETTYRQTRTDSGAIPFLRGFNVNMTTEPTFIGYWVRNDLLKQVGMDYTEINTVAEYETMLEALKGYCDGPLLLDATGFESGMLCAFNIHSGWIQRDGTAVYCPYDDTFREYLALMNKWYNAGYINKDFTNTDNSARNGYMYNGDALLFRGTYSAGATYPGLSTIEGYELAPLYYPVLNDGDERRVQAFVVSTSYVINGNVTVTTACENPALFLQYMDYWFTEDGYLLGNYGEYGVSWDWDENGDPMLLDAVLNDAEGRKTNEMLARFGTTAMCPKIYKYGITSTPEQIAITVDTWESNYNPVYAVPEYSMLASEAEAYAPIYNNINTYVSEMTLKFITGAADLQTEWENYKKNLEAMDVAQMISFVQTAMDRYYTK